MKSETAYNEAVDNEGIKLAAQDYFSESPKQKLSREEQLLKKRLQEISVLKGEDFKKTKALQQELARRRLRFKQFQFEKQLSASVIQQNACQESHVNSEGELIFGI